MANIIRIKRGLKANIASLELLPGELGVTLDTQELYVGDANSTPQLVKGAAAGVVESAEKLSTARNISISGDATGSTAFDGSKDATIALTLATSGVEAGTYNNVTVNAKGIVTAGSNKVYSIEDITGLQDALDLKANSGDVYTKNEVDAKINAKDSLPTQTDNAGKFLTTDGTSASWAEVDLSAKADASSVYTKEEINQQLDEIKEDVEDNASNLYTYQQETELNILDLDERLSNDVVTIKGGYSYTYDGNSEDKTTAASQYVKISNDILTSEELIGATVVYNNKGEESTGTITQLSNDDGHCLLFNSNNGGTVCSVYDVGGYYTETGLYVNDLQIQFKIEQYVKSVSKITTQTIEGSKDFVGGITKEGKDLATEDYVNNALAVKADTSKVYSKTETDNLLKTKVDTDSVYTKTETDVLLDAKANTSDVNTALTAKADSTALTTLEESLNNKIDTKANKATTLTGYGITDAYTQTEVNDLLATKAVAATTLAGYNISDAYTKAEVDGMVAGTFHFRGEKDSYEELATLTGMKEGDVYQVGDKEYAYNGTDWVELGFNVDLSGYLTTDAASKTYATIANLATKADSDSVYTKTQTDNLLNAKAAKATTLAGYGITDAYTKTAVDGLLDDKADAATTLAGYQISDAYTKTEIDTKVSTINSNLATKLDANSVIDGGTFE